MANLALDFGNTLIKAASFNQEELLEFNVFESPDEFLKNKAFILKHQHAIIASVTEEHLPFIHEYSGEIECMLFSSDTLIPIHNAYKSPETLGSDRLVASIGSYSLYPDRDVLTIDCGTCIKYNFVDKSNRFRGGAISPGLKLRYKSLNDHTSQLPLVTNDADFKKLIGETTQESILSGVINGAIKEVDGIIDEYKLIYPNIITLITGGDGIFFEKRLKNSIFTQPNLVLIGLNKTLEFNLEKK